MKGNLFLNSDDQKFSFGSLFWTTQYDQAYNASFYQKLELLQYSACLAMTGAIRGTSREKLYEELGLESLQLRR